MDPFRRTLETIQAGLGKMDATQKLLIGSLAVVLGMTFFLVAQYSGRTDMVDILPGATPQEIERAQGVLRTSGVRAEVVNGSLMVPTEQEVVSIARLEEGRAMPGDSRQILFSNLDERQSWRHSRRQNEQLFSIALQGELGRVIEQFTDVKSAQVIVDVPPPNGLGVTSRTPTASVTVFTHSGTEISQAKVDAIAEMVAGAQAGLEPTAVRVVDGSSGRARKPTDPDEAAGSEYLDRAARFEKQLEAKLAGQILAHIPGVAIAVTAQVDVTRRQSETRSYLAEGQGTQNLIKSEDTATDSLQNTQRGAEGGVRSNQQADISRGGASGERRETSEARSEFEAFPGTTVERVVDPRGMPTLVAVSINVPQGYIETLLVEGDEVADRDPAEDGGPTQEQILLKFEEVQPQIVDSVRPHVAAMTSAANLGAGGVEEQIAVRMVPVSLEMVAGAGGAAAGILGGGGGGLMASAPQIFDKAVLAVLALVSVAMMVSLVRKAGKQPEMPSAEEIVGIPPALQDAGDLIGEAEESESALEGLEVDDEHMQRDKMRDQLTTLVSEEPEMAARLLNRWAQSE
ncbi:MAG: hypothetical protein AAGB51_00415 [Planctomycetota bacterium]